MKKVECRMQNENAPRRGLRYFRILPSAFFIFLVRIYQLVLSPAKNVVLGPAGYCRFEPSCSQYAVEALKTHGAVSGSWLAAKRICRCHPWGAYGEDPVPPIKAGTSRGDVPVRVERTEPASEKATPLARLNAARTSQRAVPATAELPVSSVGFL